MTYPFHGRGAWRRIARAAGGNASVTDDVTPLRELHLTVEHDERIAIVAPRGGGKTTLMHCLSGILPPTRGDIAAEDEPLTGIRPWRRASWRLRHFGLLFPRPLLVSYLTAYENVELPLRRMDLSGADRRRQVLLALQAVNAAEDQGLRPDQLTELQKTRVGLARAIATDPTLIVADEPAGALTPDETQVFLRQLGDITRALHKPCVLLTCEPHTLEAFAPDATLLLRDGALHAIRGSAASATAHAPADRVGPGQRELATPPAGIPAPTA